jgi:hypothetical protein
VSATVFLLNFNPNFSKISLSGLVFDGVVALVGAAQCQLFVQNPTRTQALTLADADSAVGVGLKSCLKRPTS